MRQLSNVRAAPQVTTLKALLLSTPVFYAIHNRWHAIDYKIEPDVTQQLDYEVELDV